MEGNVAPSFADINISSWLEKKCNKIGLNKPTPVQANCIPKILEGQNCIGVAKTGSGKTLAFALPIIQKLDLDKYGFYALILTPTRELAFQIADQFNVLGYSGMKTCVIVGGMDMIAQGLELSKNPPIVIATPGRFADHLESCPTFSLSKLRFLVFDEADRLLSGGFDDQLATILSALPDKSQRQTLLFSATMADTFDIVKEKFGSEMCIFEDKGPTDSLTVSGLQQEYLLCPLDVKDAYFVQLLRVYLSANENGNIMIFTDSCKRCQILSYTLNEVGMENVALHGMMKQKERLAALNVFKSNRVKILISTDVASRGLDIPTVQLVINHNVPKEPKDYVHRVGRTARAGRRGRAVTIVTPYDLKLIQAIEELIKVKLTEFKVDDKEVSRIFAEVLVTKGEAHMKLDETDFFEKKLVNLKKKWLIQGLDPDEEEKKLLKKRNNKSKKGKVKRLKKKMKDQKETVA